MHPFKMKRRWEIVQADLTCFVTIALVHDYRVKLRVAESTWMDRYK